MSYYMHEAQGFFLKTVIHRIILKSLDKKKHNTGQNRRIWAAHIGLGPVGGEGCWAAVNERSGWPSRSRSKGGARTLQPKQGFDAEDAGARAWRRTAARVGGVWNSRRRQRQGWCRISGSLIPSGASVNCKEAAMAGKIQRGATGKGENTGRRRSGGGDLLVLLVCRTTARVEQGEGVGDEGLKLEVKRGGARSQSRRLSMEALRRNQRRRAA